MNSLTFLHPLIYIVRVVWLLLTFLPSEAFMAPGRTTFRPHAMMSLFSSASQSFMDCQDDFGRGEDHLSAFVEEGDVVVYQTGSWTVDGVPVGNGSAASFEFALVDTLQVVWTHNCEHGVLRGIRMELVEPTVLRLIADDYVEWGPEQLRARINGVTWDDGNQEGLCRVSENMDDHSMWL